MTEIRPLVTVIVPLFNKVRFLKKSVESLTSQTYPNLEIIIIDDQSTDNSFYVAHECADHDPRIRIVANEKNLGLYATRFKGIELAHGKYIAFADADDWYENNAIEKMTDIAEATKTDLVQIRFQRRMKGVKVKKFENLDSALSGRLIGGEEFRKLASYVGMGSNIYPSCWGKLFPTDIVRQAGIYDFKGFWGEDQIFNINYLNKARSVYLLDWYGYNYRWGGETTTYKYNLLHDFVKVHEAKLALGQDPERTYRELESLLRYHIRQLITELGWTREAVEFTLHKELRNPVWKNAGITDSPDKIISEETASIKNNPMKYFAKIMLR